MSDLRYEACTDSVAEKLRLLAEVYRSGNHDLAMSLAESIKDTLSFERQTHGGVGDPTLAADRWRSVAELPAPWRQWADGWAYWKAVAVTEPCGLRREREPVALAVAFRADQIVDPSREVRVARLDTAGGTLVEVPSQVCRPGRRGGEVHCRLIFPGDVAADGQTHYLIFHGNPAAELPDYPTDLKVEGNGFGLDISNGHYVARLSRQMGQLERLTYRREHGLELFAGGPGHGEPPGVDWAHDYVPGDGIQKLRITNWAHCPNYEVSRGPLCVEVRRWGFPHSPLHPLFTPSRLHIDITYTFFAGLPYFLKRGRMDAVKDLDISALRDDEWVFSGFSFTDPLWLDSAGRVHEGAPGEGEHDMHGIGYFNRHSRDAFIALWLDFEADHVEGLQRWATPMMYYRPHGHCWARYPLGGNPHLKAGATLRQRNAFLLGPYFAPGGAAALGQSRGDVLRGPVYADTDGVTLVEETRQRLLQPLGVQAAPLPAVTAACGTRPLARRGETAADAPQKAAIWQALREVKDAQFYTLDANVVDLGYVYDLRVRAETVTVRLSMPHRGRPVYSFIGDPIRERLLALDGVREVIIDCTWEPPWTAARMTAAGRRTMGLDAGLQTTGQLP
jgi:metal-sulfur cluster biosynthetic enzyme